MVNRSTRGQCRQRCFGVPRRLALVVTLTLALLAGAFGSPRLTAADSFGQVPSLWENVFCIGAEVCRFGDFNGDGRDDIAAFVRDAEASDTRGTVYVALSRGSGFGPGILWHDLFCLNNEFCAIGDFNGDGNDDIASFVRSSGDVYVAPSDGTRFDQSSLWQGQLCFGDDVCDTGDFNGDWRHDAIAFVRNGRTGEARGDVYVGLETSPHYRPQASYLPLMSG